MIENPYLQFDKALEKLEIHFSEHWEMINQLHTGVQQCITTYVDKAFYLSIYTCQDQFKIKLSNQ